MDPISLAQAGPVAILLVAVALLYRAFQRQDIVPGQLYRDERDARLRAESVTAANTVALAENTLALKDVTATVKQSLENRAAGGGPVA